MEALAKGRRRPRVGGRAIERPSPPARGSLRAEGRRLGALALLVPLYLAAREPEVGAAERADLAARFRFEGIELDAFAGERRSRSRAVHPSLAHLRGWISSVGASIALGDLDGDGLPNDLCTVDTESDLVVVAPAPGTGARYAPFVLDPAPLAYERATTAPMGCRFGDWNEDGLTDLLVYSWNRSPVVFLRRDAAPGAPPRPSPDQFVARELVTPFEPWSTNALTQADVDGDGHLDLVVGNYFPDGARVLDERAGGIQDLHDGMTRAFDGGGLRVLLWRGARGGPEPDVRFEEAPLGLAPELTGGWTLALAAADLDGDRLPELYAANDFGPDRLLANRSTPGAVRLDPVEGARGPFTPRSKALGRDAFKGMGAEFADLDGDGRLDLFVSNLTTEYGQHEAHLAFLATGEDELLRRGRAPFVERGERLGLARSGWAWDARAGDFDNDGRLELVQATGFLRGEVDRWPEIHETAMGNDQLLSDPRAWHRFAEGDDLSGRQADVFWVRARSGRFTDLAAEVGLGSVQVTRGVATADVDGDGRLDLALARQWAAPVLHRNVAPAAGAFLGLRLRLALDSGGDRVASSPGRPDPGERTLPAIGAEARVHAPGGALVAQVDGGNGHSGQRSPDLHFGLGRAPAGEPVLVELRWRGRDGRVEEAAIELAPGWHTVRLGAGSLP